MKSARSTMSAIAGASLLGAPLLLAAALLLAACGNRPVQPFENLGGDGRRIANPFAPARLEVHPLTRLDTDPDGKTLIVCHIELKDEWGDSCKGRGQLRIELYRPTGPRASGPGVQELKWDVDLRDLERNAALYDPATRTYRLPLEGVPGWLGDADPAAGPRARLRAVFGTENANGESHFLQDEFVLE